MPPMIADMVRVQLLSGARPGEICILRPCDLEGAASREYRPFNNKTEHHDRERIICICFAPVETGDSFHGLA